MKEEDKKSICEGCAYYDKSLGEVPCSHPLIQELEPMEQWDFLQRVTDSNSCEFKERK